MEVEQFDTGAVRSSDANGVAMDLVSPIGAHRALREARASAFIVSDQPDVSAALHDIYLFLSGNRNADWLARAALALFTDHRCPLAACLMAVGEAAREGSLKYSAYNWERGMPIRSLLNHATRHLCLFLDGDRSEPHLPHAAWGLFAAMHSEELWPHLNAGQLRVQGCKPPSEPGE